MSPVALNFSLFKVEYEGILLFSLIFIKFALTCIYLTAKLLTRKYFPKVATSNKLYLLATFAKILPIVLLGYIIYSGYNWIFLGNYQFIDTTNVSYADKQTVWIDATKPIKFVFDKPMDFSNAKYDNYPELAGEWVEAKPGIIPWVRTVEFIPSETPKPNTNYQFYISGLKKLNAEREGYDFYFEAKSGAQQKVVSHELTSTGILFRYENNVYDQFSDYHLEIYPHVNGTFKKERGGVEYVFSEALSKGIHYSIKLRQGIGSEDLETHELLRLESVKEVYESTFDAPATVTGGPVEQNKQLVVQYSNPFDKEINVSTKEKISIAFNKDLDEKSALQSFSIMPTVKGKLAYKDRLLTFTPDEQFAYKQSYTVTISQSIKSTKGGTLLAPYQVNFKIAEQIFALDIPLILQERKFECNITAATMVLNYFGINKTKLQVYEELPKETMEYDHTNKIWGDPNKGYLGDIDGNGRGYGVHWRPIAKYISQFRKTEVVENGNFDQVVEAIAAGHPVIIWWQNGRSTPNFDNWHTPDGTLVKSVNGMHTEVAKGFIGPKENPTHILLSDPWRGERKVTVEEFINLWKYYDNSGIIVY